MTTILVELTALEELILRQGESKLFEVTIPHASHAVGTEIVLPWSIRPVKSDSLETPPGDAISSRGSPLGQAEEGKGGVVKLGGKTTVIIETEDGNLTRVEFSELNEFSVNADIQERERPDGRLDHKVCSTTVTLRGQLVGNPKHQHMWCYDGFTATSENENPPHFGLVCVCGATACGNPEAMIVHNVRELPDVGS